MMTDGCEAGGQADITVMPGGRADITVEPGAHHTEGEGEVEVDTLNPTEEDVSINFL